MKYNSAIHVGADARATKEVAKPIMDILKLPHADNETKRVALEILKTATSVDHCTIANCSVVTKEPK